MDTIRYRLKPVREGYIRIKDIFPFHTGRNSQIKNMQKSLKTLANKYDRELIVKSIIDLLDDDSLDKNETGFKMLYSLNQSNYRKLETYTPDLNRGLHNFINKQTENKQLLLSPTTFTDSPKVATKKKKKYLFAPAASTDSRKVKNKKYLFATITSTDSYKVEGRKRPIKVETKTTLPMNNLNRNALIKAFRNRALLNNYHDQLLAANTDDNGEYSLFEYTKSIPLNITNIVFFNKKRSNVTSQSGAFCIYTNNLPDIDLTSLQIINTNEKDLAKINEILKDHCLIYALRQGGVEEEYLNNVKGHISNAHFPKDRLRLLPSLLQRDVVISYVYNDKSKSEECVKSTKYLYKGDNKKDAVKLCLVDDHYMVNKEFNYTLISLKNILEWMHIKDFNKMNGVYSDGRPRYNKNLICSQTVNTMTLYNVFKKNPLIFTPNLIIHDTNKNLFKNKIDLKKDLKIATNQEIYKPEDEKPKSKKPKIPKYFAADLECCTEGEHKPLIAGYVPIFDTLLPVNTLSRRVHQFTGEKCVRQMLNSILSATSEEEKPIVYFHNMKYDFHAMVSDLYVTSSTVKDNQYYKVNIIHNSRLIELRDSIKLFAVPLASFQKALELDVNLNKKEGIAYSHYNFKNIKVDKTNIIAYRNKIRTDEEKSIFDKTLIEHKKEFKVTEKFFDAVAYYLYYHKFDCMVLSSGLTKLRLLKEKLTGLDLFSKLTISSFTTSFMKKQGGYDGLYKVKGHLRNFLSKAVYGGVVRTNPLYEGTEINEELMDFDAVSLYPSAMIRLLNEYGGVPSGACHLISKEFNINDYKFCCVEIRITKINKKQNMPFIPYRKPDGILDYINDLPNNNPIELVLYKIDLEDLIQYHDIEYEFIQGVYWTGEVNRKFCDTVQLLLDERAKYRQGENKSEAMQLMCKLMANSVYGSTIIKKADTKIIYKSVKETEDYQLKFYHLINSITQINDKQFKIEKNTIDINSFNYSHIGGHILAMSKRIMREVMGTANDNDITLYYQDTDSLHMKASDVDKLSKCFREKYNRELIGKQCGQFHGDFNFNGTRDIVSVKSIFIGKKIYIDMLRGIAEEDGEDYQLNLNGELLKWKKGEYVYSYHFRWKGVNDIGILNARKDGESVYDVYRRSIEGEEINFCLNPIGAKPSFKYTKTGVMCRPDGDFVRCNTRKELRVKN